MTDCDLLRVMMLSRRFEEALARRPDAGFQLLSLGQEGVAAGVAAAMGPEDQLLTSGRSIAPALCRGLDPGAVMAELLGRVAGPCQGRAGRGHLAQPSAGFFGAHAVVGGNIAIAAGVALALQTAGTGVAVCLFGDGACASGALHETMNIAALWRLPLLLVCDNNGYSVSTPVGTALAPRRLAELARPFGIPSCTVDGMDACAVRDAATQAMDTIRTGAGPAFLECTSRRFSAHSTSARETRSRTEREADRALDPITRMLGTADAAPLWAAADSAVAAAIAFAEASPYPDPALVLALADV